MIWLKFLFLVLLSNDLCNCSPFEICCSFVHSLWERVHFVCNFSYIKENYVLLLKKKKSKSEKCKFHSAIYELHTILINSTTRGKEEGHKIRADIDHLPVKEARKEIKQQKIKIRRTAENYRLKFNSKFQTYILHSLISSLVCLYTQSCSRHSP